jgi:hypothetical protein
MIQIEILLPVTDNAGDDMAAAHCVFREYLLSSFGGFTQCTDVKGAWRDEKTGVTYWDVLTPYRVCFIASRADGDWREEFETRGALAVAMRQFPDQEAIFVSMIGEALIAERGA